MRFLLIGSILLLASACTPFGPTKPDLPAEQLLAQREAQLKQIDEWSFRGRTLIQQGKEGWNAGVNWQQNAADFHIQLTGPFSQGGVELSGNAQQVELRTSEGDHYVADTPEQLLEQVLGWRLPVSALRDWVKGLPYADEPVQLKEINDNGQLVLLQQAGWEVSFIRYVPFAGQTIPDKIFIKRDDLSMRLVISRWQ
ncbi:lipoprotein insertase outer membrane protein LolB [Methylophaga sp. OBS3]|uniref:lipoprotein insertase outer membrane protein LolB n=1 Tax=Methylophaga sp. OBS3 TaxID=2991934 RepID=UPI002250DB15|nr:lipoprotein insertase outer membrane protein LolB [Methylophaga sp. OBS3]MCX4189605.1 lipoprotein insertase outer membrane protein LolB [Methylophaga sp. OBS3]